jgi:hypothetical protein
VLNFDSILVGNSQNIHLVISICVGFLVNLSNEKSVIFDATPLEPFDDEESDAVEGGGEEGVRWRR